MQYVLQAISTHGAKSMADAAKVSERHVGKSSTRKAIPSEKALAKLHAAAEILDNASASEQVLRQRVKTMIHERQISTRKLAAAIGTDPSNLAKVLSGGRPAGNRLIRIHEYLISITVNCSLGK